MRQVQIFSGTSHQQLVEGICDRLGQKPGTVQLGKFSNGETRVQIQTSIREQDVFIVQSGSGNVNDAIVELLIMISACKSGSARTITAVMPYFPYARQSKKKSHRGAITAKLVADLLGIAGVTHVITIDLHASQMQGFFKCPVDNLIAEPLLARWIKVNVPDWKQAVVVSKNPGGTKRVTSLADALKISFGIITAEQARPHRAGTFSLNESMVFDGLGVDKINDPPGNTNDGHIPQVSPHASPSLDPIPERAIPSLPIRTSHNRAASHSRSHSRKDINGAIERERTLSESTAKPDPVEHAPPSPHRYEGKDHESSDDTAATNGANLSEDEDQEPEYTDERARHVVHGRLVHGHVVDESFPSPSMSAISGGGLSSRHRAGTATGGPPSDDDSGGADHMTQSFMSTASSTHLRPEFDQPLGGSYDAAQSSEEEEDNLNNPEFETHVTLVGNVKDRPVFIVDDIIDRAASWIAAAETVVKRGGATKVYCMATHGVFGANCLALMEDCDCIERIIVTNSFPIPPEKMAQSSKLTVMSVQNLLAEAIRRNHHGESISQLFMHYD